MQQIYRRTHMPKCNFNNFIETTLWHGYSPVNLLHIFRKPFPKNTFGGLLLKEIFLRFSNSPLFLNLTFCTLNIVCLFFVLLRFFLSQIKILPSFLLFSLYFKKYSKVLFTKKLNIKSIELLPLHPISKMLTKLMNRILSNSAALFLIIPSHFFALKIYFRLSNSPA